MTANTPSIVFVHGAWADATVCRFPDRLQWPICSEPTSGSP
jgi:hypothetical protein